MRSTRSEPSSTISSNARLNRKSPTSTLAGLPQMMLAVRRGRRTANIIWGNPASVLVGDFLFSRAFELMVEDGSLRVLRILSNASAVIAEGEVDQLTAQRRIETTEERYL